MCGIVGGVGLASKEFVNQNYLKLNRRGPDSQNEIHLTNGLSFGAARLAMTDPNPRSNQPMVDPESGDLIVFNGEIYNYKEIRTKLEKSGLVFRTQSDTEVLLKAISKDFLEGCKDLEGMFAFAHFNLATGTLTLSRDFLGKKPLYYMKSIDGIFFSSELKLLASFFKKKRINEAALSQYLQLGYISDPMTIYEDIFSIKPGEILQINVNNLSQIKSTALFPKAFSNENDRSIKDLLNESIKRRVAGHDRVAISLSGGLDSTLIALEASKFDVEVDTFSVNWPDSDKAKYNLDSTIAFNTANKLGLKHFQVQMPKTTEIPGLLESYVNAMQEPNSNPTGLSLFFLYNEIAEHKHRLVLTGDGADEIFGGYERYLKVRKTAALGNIKLNLFDSKLSKKFQNRDAINSLIYSLLNQKSFQTWAFWHRIADEIEVKKLINSKFNLNLEYLIEPLEFRFNKIQSKTGKVMLGDLAIWLTMESNRKLDRVSMWHSIEARSPFQDEQLIAKGLSLMQAEKYKILGKKMLVEQFPEVQVLGYNREKYGFISPVGHWLRSNQSFVSDCMKILEKELSFEKKELIELQKSPNTGDFHGITRLWNLLVLSAWLTHA